MTRLAVCIGIDEYARDPLKGCIADAGAMDAVLSRHADGSKNFDCRTFRGGPDDLSRSKVTQLAEELFAKNNVDIALFYFAGHGARAQNRGGYLVTQDAAKHDFGFPMIELIGLANKSPAKDKVIVLDCCHAGAANEFLGLGKSIEIEPGVAILAACGTSEYAEEHGGRGVFTRHICSALNGGAADVRGHVTVPATYAYVNEVLGGWKQQPMLHANLGQLAVLRKSQTAVSDELLRDIVVYFKSQDEFHRLSPDHESTSPSADPEKVEVFRRLQRLRAARLVEPNGADHMYDAAMNEESCSLTPLGKFYWHQVKEGKI
jgi:Caspase domain